MTEFVTLQGTIFNAASVVLAEGIVITYVRHISWNKTQFLLNYQSCALFGIKLRTGI